MHGSVFKSIAEDVSILLLHPDVFLGIQQGEYKSRPK